MDHPPFNIFTQRLDPEGALAKLRERLPDHEVVYHPDGTWSAIKGQWKRGWLKKPLSILVKNNPDYYSGTEWQTQLSGLANYLHRFPGSEARPDIFGYIPGLTFVLSFALDPAPSEGDPRQELVFDMVKFMDGVIFLPSCLLDGEGRVLAAADGQVDEDATLPAHVPTAAGPGTREAAAGTEEPELHPPSLDQIQARFVLMAGLVERGFMEDAPEAGQEQRRAASAQRLRQSPAWEIAEDWELEALECPVGQLEEKTGWRLGWLSEGAIVLAWALQLAELPAYDAEVDVEVLYAVRDKLLRSDTTVALRAAFEIDQLAFQMLAIHWRLRQFAIEGKATDFATYAKRSWCGEMDLSLAKLIDNDLSIGGVPLAEAADEDWQGASGIMEERRKAAHWLQGHNPVYSENDTST